MAFSQISTSVSIISSGLKGYQAISLTNFVTSAESIIASGSAIEIANAFFLADGNVTPNASSWTAVTTANTAYIALTPSGSAGNQVLSAAYTEIDPTWVLSKGGWYASAGSLTRYVASVFKDGTSSYANAHVMEERQGELVQVIRDLGEWNMDATEFIVPDLGGIAINSIRSLDIIIVNDDDSQRVPLYAHDDGFAEAGGYWFKSSTDLRVQRNASGVFDGAAFNGTASTVPNRGWMYIGYIL